MASPPLLISPASRSEAAVILTTYQKPRHLKLALASLARQADVEGRFELVVVDDGSTDETPDVVAQFAATADFPVRFTTHPHETFQAARSRNEGVAASTADYLIFLDGDCIAPPDFIKQHLAHRRPGVAMNGDCYRLEEGPSALIDESAVDSCSYLDSIPRAEIQRIAKWHRRAVLYNLIRHPRRPKLLGNNIGLWRTDFERINGFDENYQGWGCEDDDLGDRLRRAGIGIRSIMGWVRTYHVWHPRDVTWTAAWSAGPNVAYLRRKDRPFRCVNGLVKPVVTTIELPSRDEVEIGAEHSPQDEPVLLSYAEGQAQRAKTPAQRRVA